MVFTICCYCSVNIHGQDLILEKLSDQINSASYDEIAPCISDDGQTLYFTRVKSPDFSPILIEDGKDLSKQLSATQYDAKLRNIYSMLAGHQVYDPINSAFNQDIWIARSVGATFDMVYHPGYPINNALPNSISTLMPSGHEMVVINQFEEAGGMKKGFSIIKQAKNGEWSFPEPVAVDGYYNTGSDVSLSMSTDGQAVIIAMEGADAIGKGDLYVSFKIDGDKWSQPKNLGAQLNTPYRESTPYLSADQKTLFYASNRSGQSGSDIYVQTRLDDTWQNWSPPKRFRSPINSRYHDSHPYFNHTTGYLYFTSRRDGSWDIFRIQIEKPAPSGIVVNGIVLNRHSMTPVASDIIVQSADGKKYEYFPTAKNGTFKVTIPKEEVYHLLAKKEGFSGDISEVFFEKNDGNDRLFLRLYLDPSPTASNIVNNSSHSRLFVSETPETIQPTSFQAVYIGQKLELAPIFFQKSTSTVLRSSYPALNELGQFMKQHPNVHILVSGHTDNQGDQQLLARLSGERALAIKEYLVYRLNINENRIQTIGKGSSEAINDNSSEKLRRKNRRVEVIVTSIDDNSLGMSKTQKKLNR